MPRRLLTYLGAIILLLVVLWLLSRMGSPHSTGPTSSSSSPSSSSAAMPPSVSAPLLRPRLSVATFGVLTDHAEAELAATINRERLASRVGPELCGDDSACQAVRATLLDDHATTLVVMPTADWNLGRIDVDASAVNLSSRERASIPMRRHVVVVNVEMPTSPQHLALRAALAASAAIARTVSGLVYDPLLSRLETANAFAAHAVTDPLGASAFRRDRVEVLYEPKDEGGVRVLSAGLSRWGAPDVEAARVPVVAAGRIGEIVLAIAGAIADGHAGGPLRLTRDGIARANGEPPATEADLAPPAPIAIDLVSVHPEGGDPNDFIARIEPPMGGGPMGYVELTEHFFGSLFEVSADVMQKRRAHARQELPSALQRWVSSHAGGARLLVQLPFAIPGDAGVESMWVEVERYDRATVSGRLVDEPLGATNISRGTKVTRQRDEVEDLRETLGHR